MTDNRINYLLVGSFVLLMLIGLVTSIAKLTGRTGATDPYYTIFESVLGVSYGTQVLYQGYPVGQVESIEPIRRDGRQAYRLEMSVSRGWQIPNDSRVSITTGLLSAVNVNILGGEAEHILEPGSEIASIEAADVFAVFTDIAGEAGELVETTVRPLLEHLGDRIPVIVDNLDSLSEELNVAARQVGEIFTHENTDSVSAILRNAESVSANFDELSLELAETNKQLTLILDKVDQIVDGSREPVEKAVVDLRYTLESVAQHIDALNHNLEGTSRNMNEFSRRIRANPGLLLGGSSAPDDGEAAAVEK